MKVNVIKYLNVRVGEPLLNAPCYQYLAPGSELEVDGNLYNGDIYNGIDTWFKDEAGNYYWSGGVEEIKPNSIAEESNSYPKWMIDLAIPKIWSIATGKNVGVAVVDTGITDNNRDLPYNKENHYLFSNDISLLDIYGHGTHCAGLIGAKNNEGNIIGVAPDCELFICKIAEGSNIKEIDTIRYAEAINWCANQKEINIISISWGSFIDNETIISNIQKAVNNAIGKNKIVVCAIGDASKFDDPGPLYPSFLKNTISIGSIPIEGVLYPYINKSLTTSITGNKITSYGLDNNLVQMTGTSQSNAIIAGICALIIEKKNFKYTPEEIKQVLKEASTNQLFLEVEIPVLSKDLLLQYFQS